MYYDMASFTNYTSYRAGIIIVDGTTIIGEKLKRVTAN